MSPAFRQHPALTLALLIGAVFLCFLGAHPYITPSEARYIEVARQMATTGDWVVPHINGVPYFEKPAGFYWVQAAFYSVFGPGEFAQRLPTALLSVALCLLTYALAATLWTRREGVAAALVLASSWMGFSLSRMVMLDVPLTVCMTAALLCFLKIAREEKPSPWIVYGMYVAAAGGVLTKGLIAGVLPGMIALPWLIITRRWDVLQKLRIPTGALLFFALAAPWHIAAGMRYPQFWNFYFIHEHFTRFLTEEHHRDHPLWFFPAVLMVGFMPWTFQLFRTLWRERMGGDPYRLFLILWAAIPFVFFSLSHSKLVPYIYPCWPPLCALLAPALVAAWDRKARSVRITAVLAACTPMVGYNVQMLAPTLWRGSVKPMVEALAPQLCKTDEVAIYDNYRQDLPLYLNRNVTVVDYQGELTFGTSIAPETRRWMMSNKRFQSLCRRGDHRMIVLMPKEAYDAWRPQDCPLYPLDVGAPPPDRFVLLTNEKPTDKDSHDHR